MLSSLLIDFKKISNDLDIQEYLDLDERCIQILIFLLLHLDTNFTHNLLKRRLNDFGFNFQEPTYSRHLNHLEEKGVIERIRNHTTTIRLNLESLDEKIRAEKAVSISIELFDRVKKGIKEYSVEEIFEDLKKLYIEKGSASLALKLGHMSKKLSLKELQVGYTWINIIYEYVIDMYLEEVERKGLEAIAELTYLYRKTIPSKIS